MQAFLPEDQLRRWTCPPAIAFVLGLILASALSVLDALVAAAGGRALDPRSCPGAVMFGVGMRLLGLAASTYFAYRLDRSERSVRGARIAIVMMLFLFLVARLFVAAQFLNATLHRRRRRPADVVEP